MRKAEKQKRNREHQRAHRERMRAAGFKQSLMWIHTESRQRGFSDALMSERTILDVPDDVEDSQSWRQGFIEALMWKEMRGM